MKTKNTESMDLNIKEKLMHIQTMLNAPKNQFNSFGKYNYRSCEDILEALKPLLLEYDCTLTINDEIKSIGSIAYVEAKVTLIDNKTEQTIIVNASAGIDPNRKGMDISQCFGASSSYSRKYALAGLFLLDDVKDADSTNTHDKDLKSIQNLRNPEDEKQWLNKGEPLEKAKEFLSTGGKIEQIEKKYKISKEIRNILENYIP